MTDTPTPLTDVEHTLFDDGKDPHALRTIGEVSKAFGLKAHVLRYWEEQFPALQPIKRSGNRRYYRPQDVALIGEIDRLVHGAGYTLRGAAKAIADAAPTAPSRVGAARPEDRSSSPDSADMMARLTAIRDRLADALAAA
ncbi:MerR family transcriptional regulator [Novosphingobium sp. Leaf2]|uniref:MerR family transcriptional regulator n=1 Tax=Novosphingobium sp. Leaf2 TaxID=1735670 RepID=UPI0006F2E333|nr:MerR family transcriptional regulator [Novosphingobium sp. Leaf2]KQM13079.1 transcriptional regulator [Novosphingobium sp. Leaf2]